MNKERLLNVAKALRESKNPEMFDMEYHVHHECGTPACAFGHYAARQDLQDAFKIVFDGGWRSYWIETTDGQNQNVWWDDDCVREHFDISDKQARLLFFSKGCGNAQTPTEAAEYIEHFVAENG
jgi:hypothetical protein